LVKGKKIIRLGGIICGLLLVAIWGAGLVLETRYTRDFLLARLHEKIPGHLLVEELGVNLFTGRLDIGGLRLLGPEKQELVRVKSLGANLSWSCLLAAQICLSSVSMVSPELDLQVLEDGSLDFLSAFAASDPSPAKEDSGGGLPFNILVDQFLLTRGAVSFKQPGKDMSIFISGVDILISDVNLLKAQGHLGIGFETGNISRQGATPLVLDPFQIQADFGDGGVSNILVRAGAEGLDLTLKGGIRDLLTLPFLDMTLESKMEMESLARVAGINYPFPRGEGTLDLSVHGTIDNPKVTCDIHSETLDFNTDTFRDLTLQWKMKDRQVTILPSGGESRMGNLSLTGTIDLARGFPDGFREPFDLDQIAYTLGASISEMQLSALPGMVPGREGRLTSKISLGGTGIDPQRMKADLTAELKAAGLRVGVAGEMDVTLHLDAGLDKQMVSVRSVRLTGPGAGLTGQGQLDIRKRVLSGTLGLKADDIGPLASLARVKGRGTIQATAEIEGSFLSPLVSLSALGSNLGINDFFLGDLAVKAGLEKSGRVIIDKFKMENPASFVTAQGWVDLSSRGKEGSVSLDVAVANLDLGKVSSAFLPPEDSPGGLFNGKIKVRGRLENPVVKAVITGKNLSYHQGRIQDLSARFGFSKGVLVVETLDLAHGKSSITGSGRANLLDAALTPIPDPEIQLSLRGNSVLLEDFFPDLTGHLSVDGQVKGTLSSMAGSLTIDGNSFVLGGQTIDRLSSQILFKGRNLEISKMEIQVAPGAVVTAKGQVSPMDQTLDLQLDSKNFDLTCLNLLEKPGVDKGRLSLNLSARGSFQDPMVKGEIGVRDLMILKEKQAPLDFLVDLKNRQLKVKGNLGPALEGTYDLDTRAFSAALDMEGTSLSAYFTLAGQPELTGKITGRIRAEGQADNLDRVRASADFSNLAVAYSGIPFVEIKNAGATFENGMLNLSSTRIELLEKGSFTVRGQGSLGGEVDFKGQGEIPLEIINPLVREIESATGLIRVNASLGGTLAEPKVSGEILFDKVGMALAGIEQDFKGVEGRIKLSQDKIEILGFKGYLDKGRFDLGGSLGLNQWAVKTIDLALNAHQLNLEIPDTMDLSLNCGVKFSGTDAASALTGEVVLLSGRYYKDVELDLLSAATQRTRKEALVNEDKPSDFLKNIGLNVNILRREPLLVDNNLAYLEISPDLTIKGTAAVPLLAGRAQVDSGRIFFQRSEFEVKKGVIDFLNPYAIEPMVDIEGESEIRDWTISLAVSGTPDNLAFSFSSNPSEQDGDILSLIAFGKTTRELRAADGGGRGASEGFLAGMVAGTLEKNLKDSTGLDHIEINTDDADNTGSQGVNVTVGTDLSREITVKYGVDVRNGETVHRVTTDYKLLEQLLMSGYQDTGGNFGGELKYRLEFR
jgi:translocation and assembly module TamB